MGSDQCNSDSDWHSNMFQNGCFQLALSFPSQTMKHASCSSMLARCQHLTRHHGNAFGHVMVPFGRVSWCSVLSAIQYSGSLFYVSLWFLIPLIRSSHLWLLHWPLDDVLPGLRSHVALCWLLVFLHDLHHLRFLLHAAQLGVQISASDSQVTVGMKSWPRHPFAQSSFGAPFFFPTCSNHLWFQSMWGVIYFILSSIASVFP